MTEHMNCKHALNSMSKADIENILDAIVLSEEERDIMELIYIQRKSLSYIADIMGYSESGIKKIHCRVLKRITNLR